jgi:hypothetical protein
MRQGTQEKVTTKYWIKLYMEILDDPKMGRLPNHLWRRTVELFLLAGREGDDGALPPVEEMVWILRLSEDKLLEDLHDLAEVGVVHTCVSTTGTSTSEADPKKWVVTNFSKRQAAIPVAERVRRLRDRNKYVTHRYRNSNEGEGVDSPSPSESDSDSNSGEGVLEKETPRTPAEAMLHTDIRVFAAVTSGRIPGLSQYTQVIDSVRYLRKVKNLDDQALAIFLTPYWLAWSGRKRLDGRPYDPGNITWLTEWALNETIPPMGIRTKISGQEQAEVIRQVAKEQE